MSFSPYISVIITTHNRPELLERCIKSILVQQVANEIILCGDEGSSETKSVAINNLRENDSLVIVPGLKGPAATRNIGLKLAKGKWICFLDDDDSYEKNYFEEVISLLKEDENIVNYFNYKQCTYDEFGKLISENKVDLLPRMLEDIKVCNFIPNNAVMIPSLIAKKYKVDESLESHEDWEYLLKLNNENIFKHRAIFGPVVNLREKTRNSNSIKSKRYLFDFITIYRKWPSNDETIKIQRKNFLTLHGISLPIELI
jgi:glycosyltransferase involved in cell wall biosynthesis